MKIENGTIQAWTKEGFGSGLGLHPIDFYFVGPENQRVHSQANVQEGAELEPNYIGPGAFVGEGATIKTGAFLKHQGRVKAGEVFSESIADRAERLGSDFKSRNNK